MDSRVLFAAALCIFFAVSEVKALTCHNCVSFDDQYCGDDFDKDNNAVIDVSCGQKCFKASFKFGGKKYIARSCTASSNCEDISGLSFLSAMSGMTDIDSHCCEDDKCNAATAAGVTKMAAIICTLGAIFVWWNKL